MRYQMTIGREPATGLPTWLTAMPIGFQWNAISGTAGPGGGLVPNNYCDMTIRQSDATLFFVASGGHLNGDSNAARSIKLTDNSPSYTSHFVGSASTQQDVQYYADGRPTSRHTYWFTHYIPSINSVLLGGLKFGYGSNTPTGRGMDLFNITAGDYSARYTWPDIPNDYKVVGQDGDGNLWSQDGKKFTVSTQTWSTPGYAFLNNGPAAYDATNNRIVNIQWGNGEGLATTPTINTADLNVATGNSDLITFNSSAALTAFLADTPDYAGMAWCPLDGKFYFLHPGRPNRFYVFTPNYGSNWDVAIQEIAGATPTFADASLCKRLLWVDSLNGFVMQSNQNEPLYFLRMA